MKNCIKTLHKLDLHDIVHNITFIAGATNINQINKSENSTTMDMIIAKTVSGTVKSVYNDYDYVLLYASKVFTSKRLMGRQSILQDHHRNIHNHSK